ncbi:MAG TPA: hypothetical protein VFH27_10230 [Longimicrobiaceae bacterium]|nr:hypothetical protein [Longimicrobiaceae bacterium]
MQRRHWLTLLTAAVVAAACTDRRDPTTVAAAPKDAPSASAGTYGQIQYFGYVSSPDQAMVDGTAQYTNFGWFATDSSAHSSRITSRINSHSRAGLRTIVDMGNLLWCGPGQTTLCPGWRDSLAIWKSTNSAAFATGNVLAFSVRDEPFNVHANIAQVDSASIEVRRLFPGVPILLIESADHVSDAAGSWWSLYKSLLTVVDWICVDDYKIHPGSDPVFGPALSRMKAQFPGRRVVYAADGWWSPGHVSAFGTSDSTYMATIMNEWYNVAAADRDAIVLGVFQWDTWVEGKGSRDLGPAVLQAQTAIGRLVTGKQRGRAYAPVGAFQYLSSSTRVASGWACDPDGAWGETVQVDFYADGVFAGTTRADQPITLASTPGCRTGTYHRFYTTLSRVGTHTTTAVIRDLDAGSTTVYAPATVTVAWVQPSGVSWGPPNTLTAAGLTTNGSGTVQLVWRDMTANGPWNTVPYQAPLAADGSWSNTIPTSNYCHNYQVYANYSGATSPTQYYYGPSSQYCTEQVRMIWIQPASTAGFGPAGSLVVAGSATDAPAGTTVQMYWRDVTAGQTSWTAEPYTPTTDANGIWLNSIANANPLHRYAVYARYDVRTSSTCTYAGTGSITWC